MKLSLPLKLGIFVVLLFAAVIATCLLWTPLRMRYYVSKYRSNDAREIARGVRGLLSIGEKGGSELERLARDELRNAPLKRRALVADALIAKGPQGIGVLAKALNGSEKEAAFLSYYWEYCNFSVYGDKLKVFPLHFAVNDFPDAAQLLIERGADVNAKDDDGQTALHYAAGNGHKDITALLLEKGADVNAKDINDWTPLHLASEKGHKDVVTLLIEKGVNVNAMDNDGDTPLDWANNFDKKATADLLRAHSGKAGKKIREQGNMEK